VDSFTTTLPLFNSILSHGGSSEAAFGGSVTIDEMSIASDFARDVDRQVTTWLKAAFELARS
jgi:hypothetical protein